MQIRPTGIFDFCQSDHRASFLNRMRKSRQCWLNGRSPLEESHDWIRYRFVRIATTRGGICAENLLAKDVEIRSTKPEIRLQIVPFSPFVPRLYKYNAILEGLANHKV
jgi:hypothetical protein